MLSSKPTSWNLAKASLNHPDFIDSFKQNYYIMSNKSSKKAERAAKRAAREEKQAKRVINWIVGALVILFVVAFVAYAIL